MRLPRLTREGAWWLLMGLRYWTALLLGYLTLAAACILIGVFVPGRIARGVLLGVALALAALWLHRLVRAHNEERLTREVEHGVQQRLEEMRRDGLLPSSSIERESDDEEAHHHEDDDEDNMEDEEPAPQRP